MSVLQPVKSSAGYGERLHLTREMCEFLERGGLLPERYELIDGEIVSKMGQKDLHAQAVMLLIAWLLSVFGNGQVRTQSTVQIPSPNEGQAENEPEPDVLVRKVSGTTRDYLQAADVELVAEVTDTTQARDYGSKYGLYSRAGIGEYWILDLNRRVLNVYRKPNVGEGRYEETVTLEESEMVSPENRPEAQIRVGDLLPVE